MFVSNGSDVPFSFGYQNYDSNVLYASDGVFLKSFNSSGTFLNKFNGSTPVGISTDTINSVIYFINATNVVKFNFTGTYLGGWNVSSMQTSFPTPGSISNSSISVDSTNGYVFVSRYSGNGTYGHDVLVFTTQGNYITKIGGGSGTADGKFNTPNGISLDVANKRLFVVDTANNRIQIFSYATVTSITHLYSFGTSGTGNGQFAFGTNNGSGCVWNANYLYVCDSGNSRVQKLDTSTLPGGNITYNAKFGTVGTGNDNFTSSSPRAICVDSTNSILYIVDADIGANICRIKKHQFDGTYVAQFGSVGTQDNQFSTYPYVAVIPGTVTVNVDAFRDLQTPESPSVVDSGSAGNPSGTYKYRTTYVTAGGAESTGGVESNSVTVSSKIISLSNLLPSANPDVAGIYIYRAQYVSSAWGEFKYIGRIDSSTTPAYDIDGPTNTNYLLTSTTATVNGTIASTVATLVVTSAAGWPDTGEFITATGERVQYNSRTGTQLQGLVRGVNGTTAATITTGGTVTLLKIVPGFQYDDNLADANVGASVTNYNGIIPYFKYIIQHKDIMIGSGDATNPNYIYWSLPLDEHSWPAAQSTPVGDSDEGLVTGLASLGDRIIVFKDNAIYGTQVGVNDDLIDIRPYLITNKIGGISHFTICRATVGGANGLIFVDKDLGPCFLSGTDARALWDDKILTEWSTYNKTYLRNSYAQYYQSRNEYWFSVTTTGTTNNEVWVYNTDTKCLYKPFTQDVCSFGTIETSGAVTQLWSGDFAGKVYIEDSTEADSGAAIDGYFSTGWMSFGEFTKEKVFDTITVDFLQKGSWNMTVWWAVDGGAFSSTLSSTVSLAGTAGKRSKYTFRIADADGAALIGRSIRIKVSNANASEPFEVCSVGVSGRLHKKYIG
jgi:hypothetical protein